MKTESLRLVGALLAAVSLSGCYSVTYDASTMAPNTAAMSAIPESRHIRHFRVEEKGVWFVGGLLPLTSIDLKAVLAREGEGRPVQNLRIRHEIGVVDGLVTLGAAVALSFGTNLLFSPARAGGAAGNVMLLNTILASMLTPNLRTVTIEGDVVEVPAQGASR